MHTQYVYQSLVMSKGNLVFNCLFNGENEQMPLSKKQSTILPYFPN